jgi:hypothetical protein
MYCPTCGSQNLVDVKFCTRCGANLAVVSEAISGKTVNQGQPDERMVKLLKTYYEGRRATAVGGASLTVGFIILALLMAAGMPEHWSIFGLLGLGSVIYGAIAAIAGAAGWIQSSSELKALSIVASQLTLPRPAQPAPALTGGDRDVSTRDQSPTDPITEPASITEHTTRQLDEKTHSPRSESQSRSGE